MEHIDRSRTLEELERQVWPYDDFGSHVVQESQRLRKIPIGQLSIEDLRLLIGQRFGLQFLVPLAIEHLADDPLVSGDYYPGDLLNAVLSIPDEYWSEHPEFNNQLVEIGIQVSNLSETIAQELLPSLKRFQFR